MHIEDFIKSNKWKKSNGSREDNSSDKQIDMYEKKSLIPIFSFQIRLLEI